MSKPEDIPQDVWDKSIALMQGIPADFSWDGFEDAKSNHACAAEEVARAIMAAKAEEREACADAIRRANNTVGSISTPLMCGDNLAIVLCGQFDDGGPNEDDTGWSQAATAGYEQAIAAVRDHYASAIRKRGEG